MRQGHTCLLLWDVDTDTQTTCSYQFRPENVIEMLPGTWAQGWWHICPPQTGANDRTWPCGFHSAVLRAVVTERQYYFFREYDIHYQKSCEYHEGDLYLYDK